MIIAMLVHFPPSSSSLGNEIQPSWDTLLSKSFTVSNFFSGTSNLREGVETLQGSNSGVSPSPAFQTLLGPGGYDCLGQ